MRVSKYERKSERVQINLNLENVREYLFRVYNSRTVLVMQTCKSKAALSGR